MASASTSITVTHTHKNGDTFEVYGSVSITANPSTYTTGGLILDLNDPQIKAQRTPLEVVISSQAGNIYNYVPGTNNTNGTIKLFTALSTELGNGVAIPTTNSSDVITFHARFLGMN